MNEFPHREVDVFTEALQLPANERAGYLERACGRDAKLRQKVEALLQTHDQVGDFLEQSPQKTAIENTPEIPPSEKPGDRVGRYKLLEQIGEGGCGVVFMAEQEEPVRRRVAIKMIKPGMDSKNVIARFESERQALALMDHPNIARVFDAGATKCGRPYFVMQLIRGIKITEYCDQQSLTTGERLRLFIQVCRAVQHAHQKGIIHRDIKPSNILVSSTLQGEALPVVIDFGIAKATTNQQLTDKTLFTAFEMLIGTPAYMSPEQAALTSVDVDTRTDIYSLGVLLYELLTGLTPFDTGELLKAGLDEIRRVIREEEPVRPSTRLSKMTSADLTTVAQRRKSEPPTLIRSISGDLDWIVMKALEKDRTRRYETANGMALDVQCYLANETISARPPSKLYKFQKTVVRNKLLFFGVGLIALLLVLSLIIVSASLAREWQARREADVALRQAETDKAEAQTEAVKSQQVTQFLENMLNGVGPAVARGQDTKMLRGILDQTAKSVGEEMTNQPAVEAELRTLIGRLYLEIGNYGQAEEMQRTALAINRKLFNPESREAAASLNDLGLAYARDGKFAEAVAAHQAALDIRRRLFGNEHPDVAASLSNLAEMYTQQGRIVEAEALTREALAVRQKLFGNESLEAADSLRSLSIILGDEGKWDESETMARKVLAIRRIRLGPENPLVATSLTDVAWAAGGRGKLDEAESLEREALALRRKILGDEHPDVAKSLYLVGDRLREEGKLNEALTYLNEALAMQHKLLGEDNPTLLDTLHSLGLTFEAEGKLADAEKVHREALSLWGERGESEIPQAVSELESLINVLITEKKFGDAEQLLDEVLTPAFVRQPSSADLLALRADLEARRGGWQEASADAELAFELEPLKSGRYCMVAALLVKTQKRAAYDQFCQRLLSTFVNTNDVFADDQVAKACLFLPPPEQDLPVISRLADTAVTLGAGDAGAMPFFQICKALSEYRQGHFAEAAEWAQKTVESPRVDAQGHAYAVLAMADWQLGEKDKARAMLANGETIAPRIMPAGDAEDPGNAWLAWLFARITLDEATALIQPGSTNDNHANQP
jgi:eukaryotic-like serine/threonine-protein kinase